MIYALSLSLVAGRIVCVAEPIQLHSHVLDGEPAGTLHTYMEVPLASGYELSTGKAQQTPYLAIVESSAGIRSWALTL